MALKNKTVRYLKKRCDVSLKGKTALITGANGGIGFKTAEILIYLGASVVMACRNRERAEAAREKLLKDYPEEKIKIVILDISDLSSIEGFVKDLPDVDIFINNAGVFHRPGEKTKDGFELVMGTNYIGAYYLSEKALPFLEKLGHDVVFINTISFVHKFAKVDLDAFYSDKHSYSRSKLCLARYTEYLAKKYRGSNVRIYMTHPGIAMTGIASHIVGNVEKISRFLPFNSTERSSLAAAYLLSNDVPEGSVVGPALLFGGWGNPKINKKCKKALKDIDPLVAFTQKEIERVRPS